MPTALIALTTDEANERLLDAAKRYATGTDTELLICRFIDESQYRSKLQRDAESGGDIGSVAEIKERANAEAAEVARRAFGDDIRWSSLAVLGDLRDDVLRVADDHECEHVFVSGEGRSPAGKALFGDIAQAVVLEFDGPVTVVAGSRDGTESS